MSRYLPHKIQMGCSASDNGTCVIFHTRWSVKESGSPPPTKTTKRDTTQQSARHNFVVPLVPLGSVFELSSTDPLDSVVSQGSVFFPLGSVVPLASVVYVTLLVPQ